MPYRRVVKVSDHVYSRLRALTSELGFDSPNALLEHLLEWWEPLLVQSRLFVEGTWVYIEVPSGRVALNLTQASRMCRLRLLPRRVCVEVKAKVPWLA